MCFYLFNMKDVVKYMKGKDFVKKILEGERDFSSIKLEDSFNLSGFKGFEDLQRYLKKADLRHYPIILDYAKLISIQASGLYLPYVNGVCINLEEADLERAKLWEAKLVGANLSGAILMGANLEEAILQRTNLVGANLVGANLDGADLRGANLRGADLRGADLRGADLGQANLEGVNLKRTNLRKANLEIARKLETIINLGKAKLYGAIVTEKERAIIDNYLKRSR